MASLFPLWWSPPLALALALILTSCGGSAAPDLHSTFAAIQVEEARMEHADAALQDTPECADRAATCTELCDAARRIGELASAIDDRDARARSDRADVRCSACRAELASRCEEAS